MGTTRRQPRPVNLGALTFDVPLLPPTSKVSDEAFLIEADAAVARLKASGEYDRLRAREPLPTLPFQFSASMPAAARAKRKRNVAIQP